MNWEDNGFLPDCSPFSESWMSALDNKRSKDFLGIEYTPLRDYLAEIVHFYQSHVIAPPLTFRRRHAELGFCRVGGRAISLLMALGIMNL